MADCAGCLGSRSCWVCLGTGNADTETRTGVCRRCRGSAVCTTCRPLPVVMPLPAQGGDAVYENSWADPVSDGWGVVRGLASASAPSRPDGADCDLEAGA